MSRKKRTRVLTFHVPDPHRLRRLFHNPPEGKTSAVSTSGAARRKLTTRLTLKRAGLQRDEMRLIGGYRGLSSEQQAALLVLIADVVIQNARSGGQ